MIHKHQFQKQVHHHAALLNTRDPPSSLLFCLCILVLAASTENLSTLSTCTVNLDSVAVSIISAFESPSEILSVVKPVMLEPFCHEGAAFAPAETNT